MQLYLIDIYEDKFILPQRKTEDLDKDFHAIFIRNCR